ncbi:MAG: HD domain-containing protein [Nitrospirota bacterium]|nr:HD domain-containing protein [Nitrospirota bacterium]
MATSVIAAIETLMSLQRWNVMPRIENWTEAENIAYTTHVTYALARELEWNDDKIQHAMMRALLKSLNKHFLADIPVKSRRVLRLISDGEGKQSYEKLINEYAKKTARLFPRELFRTIECYMTIHGNYSDGLEGRDREEVEELVHFAQHKVALDECEINEKVYPSRGYEIIHKDIEERLNKLDPDKRYNKVYEEIRLYLGTVKNLKYLRRWNRINRTVETSVLSHTFVVTILSLMFALLSAHSDKKIKDGTVLDAILRAMFQGFPETLTGDIITPAKDILNRSCDGIWDKVEATLIDVFLSEQVPKGLRGDMSKKHLLDELSDSENYTVASLVKDCDRLALVLECHIEARNGNINVEMTSAFKDYLAVLQGSEWRGIREFAQMIAIESR